MSRVYKLVLNLALFLSVAGLIACNQEQVETPKEVAKPVKVMKIGDAANFQQRQFSGRVEAGKDVELSFQVPGQVIDFPVSRGQQVKKGDLIARLDQKDFQLKFNEAKAVFDERKTALERTRIVVEQGHLARSKLDEDTAAFGVAEANLRLAEQNLKYTEIYAPFSGQVANTYIDQYQHVVSKEPIVLLQDVNELEIVIAVPENLMIQLKNETQVLKKYAVFESVPNLKFDLEYKKHRAEADASTQSYQVWLSLAQPKELSVLPGMTAVVTVQYNFSQDKQQSKIHLIPADAVFADEQNRSFVWKVNDQQRLEAVEVKIGKLTAENIQILSGLNPGDVIVIAGVSFLRDGQWVEPQENVFRD